jgi:hypothetical protein
METLEKKYIGMLLNINSFAFYFAVVSLSMRPFFFGCKNN